MNHRERAVALLLRDAADRIDRYGLFQGEYWPNTPPDVDVRYIPGDPCCALGALALADGIDDPRAADTELDSRGLLVRAIDALTTEVHGREIHAGADALVALWNDEPGRRPGEVTAALHAAADRLDPPIPLTAAGPGGSSAKSSHQATGSHDRNSTDPNHQDDSKETTHV